MFRMVAGLSDNPEYLETVREPTGSPELMYCKIMV